MKLTALPKLMIHCTHLCAWDSKKKTNTRQGRAFKIYSLSYRIKEIRFGLPFALGAHRKHWRGTSISRVDQNEELMNLIFFKKNEIPAQHKRREESAFEMEVTESVKVVDSSLRREEMI